MSNNLFLRYYKMLKNEGPLGPLLVLTFVLTLTTSLLFSYMIYYEIPNGYSQPWKLRATVGIMRSPAFMGDLAGRLGLDGFSLRREMADDIAAMFTSRDRDLDIQEKILDGTRVRYYEPRLRKRPKRLPVVVFIHGGGWSSGSTVTHDGITQKLSKQLLAVVVSIEYSLSPEAPYPVPLNECERAVIYLMEHADDFGLDKERIAVVGDEAGGNLAAALSLKLRDRPRRILPRIKQLVLVYPALQSLDMHTPSYQQYSNAALLTQTDMVYSWLLYALGSEGARYYYDMLNNKHMDPQIQARFAQTHLNVSSLPEAFLYPPYTQTKIGDFNTELWQKLKTIFTNQYFAPLLADDLSGLPSTILVTSQHDVLRDDGFWFCERLQSEGVPVIHKNVDHGINGFLSLHDVIPEGQILLEQIIELMKETL